MSNTRPCLHVLLTLALLTGAATKALTAGHFSPPELGKPATWEPRKDWLSAVSEKFSVKLTDEGLDFFVPEPRKGMKWSAALSEMVDPDSTGYLVLTYRCVNYRTDT
ncbi:MAG: hypothetical protein J7M26_09965, partial [Armatimonadetes bacterium]|nr:hypothetical protein [Armatimonadota bacterium]